MNNFSSETSPKGENLLSVEISCHYKDETWNLTDQEIFEKCASSIQKDNLIKAQKQEQQERIKSHEQWLSDLNDHISKKEEILPGFKLSPKDKTELYKGITKLDKSGKNEIMRMREKDPEFDLKIAYLATVLKWDFSAFERQSTTKSTRKLADAIKSTKKTGSRPSRGTSKNVDFDTMRKSLR